MPEFNVLSTKLQGVVHRRLPLGSLVALIAAGPAPTPKPSLGTPFFDDYDAPTTKAIKEATTEQAKDDKTLSPKALKTNRRSWPSLDSFVQDRAEKNPENLAVQRTASHYALQRGDFKTAGSRADQAFGPGHPRGRS